MSKVWLVETGEEALGLRVLGRCAGKLHRAAQVLRNVRNRQAALSLSADLASRDFHEGFNGPCRLLTQEFVA